MLYRCSGGGLALRCLDKEEAALVLEELHSGICGSHCGGRTLAHRAICKVTFGRI